ncbi:MAG: AAA family ATPase [Acidobacteria bacterium]|nr:AAA family ATPase [Acidobacteriota bacterium]
MTKTIAITGKGGTGKSTLSAVAVRWLSDHVSKSILVVDADSNVNLNDLLGVELRETVGGIREEMKEKVQSIPGGMTKQQFLEYKIQSSIVETPDFDLIAMGRPEGPGCYCYANSILRDILKTLSGNYEYVVIDNEAGMEHLSRRTTAGIDYLLMISDPTVRGIHAAGRIGRLIAELDTRVREKYLIVNRLRDPLHQAATDSIGAEGLQLLCTVPEDELLTETDRRGESIWSVADRSEPYRILGGIFERLFV